MKKRVEELYEKAAKALTLAAMFDKFSPDSKQEIVQNIFAPIREELISELLKAKNEWAKNLK